MGEGGAGSMPSLMDPAVVLVDDGPLLTGVARLGGALAEPSPRGRTEEGERRKSHTLCGPKGKSTGSLSLVLLHVPHTCY